MHGELKRIFGLLNEALENDPPPEIRRVIWHMAKAVLRQIIGGEYTNEKIRRLIGKISNGFEYWFTFVLHHGVEPTNNKA
jgi:transposase